MSYKNPVTPVTAKDKKLSMDHLKDSLKYNQAHAKDHQKEVKAIQKMMKKRGK